MKKILAVLALLFAATSAYADGLSPIGGGSGGGGGNPNVSNATGTLPVANGGTGANTGIIIVSKTSNYSVLASDDLTHFNNTGATTSVTFTQPVAATGHNSCYLADAAQTIIISADSGHTIRNGSSITVNSGNFTSNGQIGEMLCIEAINSTEWYVTKITGSWTVN